jgi:Lrp/AsnC family transcriptional regulator, leucine-responsive regulatory protein
MDARDARIVTELDRNPKMSEKELGKKLHLSQQVVSYRIKKLFEEKAITKITPIFDLNRLGLEHYRIFFRLNQISEQKRKVLFDYIKKQPQVFWAARIGGRYDLLLVLFVKNYLEFDSFIEHMNKAFPNTFRDHLAVYGLYHEYYVHKHFKHTVNPDPIAYYTYVKSEEVDDLDVKVMQLLKDNARQSSLSIGQQLGVSYKTVQNRIKSLVERKILLGYRIFIRSEEFKPFIVLLSFKEYSKQKEQKLLTELRLHQNITQTVRLFGRWQLFAHVRINDIEALQQLLIQLRERHDLIDEYELIPVFEDISINVLPLSGTES